MGLNVGISVMGDALGRSDGERVNGVVLVGLGDDNVDSDTVGLVVLGFCVTGLVETGLLDIEVVATVLPEVLLVLFESVEVPQ